MSSFADKIVLVTGGARGIGYLMGKKALERGARHLIIWDVDEDRLLKIASQLTKEAHPVSAYVVDVGNPERVSEVAKEVLSEHHSVDILINNAGVVVGKPFQEHSMNDITKTMDVNSLGLMYVARAFLPSMIKKNEGHIVNIASAAGLTPNPGMTVYAGSKWAAVGWSESLRIELNQLSESLKVLTVMPGYINTGMFAGVSPPFLMPLLDPNKISDKILDAVERNKIKLQEPFLVKLTTFTRGILPAKLYDLVAEKVFKVYDSMNTFIGRNQENT